MLDHGMTAAQAHGAANRGELPGIGHGLAPFPVPLTTVASWGTEARRDRRATEVAGRAPATVLEVLCAELTAELERQVKRMRSRRKPDKLSPDEIGKIARAGVEVAKLRKMIDGAGGQGRAQGNGTASAETPEPAGFVEQWAADIAQRG
jgi:hypothetical protein